MVPLPYDCLVTCVGYLQLADAARARQTSTAWRRAARAAHPEIAWVELRAGAAQIIHGVRPHHLHVDTALPEQGVTLVVTDQEGERVGIPCPEGRVHWSRVDDSAWWFCASGRRVFELTVSDCGAAALALAVLPPCGGGDPGDAVRVDVLPNLDSYAGADGVVGRLTEHPALHPFCAYHSYTNTILFRVGDRVVALVPTVDLAVPFPHLAGVHVLSAAVPPTVTVYDGATLQCWQGFSTCVYVATRTSLIIMSSISAIEVDVAAPHRVTRLPGICYGVSQDGRTVYGTRNFPKHSEVVVRRDDEDGWATLRRFEVGDMNALALNRRTSARLFLQDVGVAEGVVCVAVNPAGPLPPAALVTLSTRDPTVLLSCIVFDAVLPRALGYHPFGFTKNSLFSPFYAFKLSQSAARAPVVTVLLPKPPDHPAAGGAHKPAAEAQEEGNDEPAAEPDDEYILFSLAPTGVLPRAQAPYNALS